MATTLTISTSAFVVEHDDVLDQVLQALSDDGDVFPVDYAATASPTSPSRSTSTSRPRIEPKQIKRELDPIALTPPESQSLSQSTDTAERTEYYTVSDYVWPTPPKRQCQRMSDELRRQRHREAQREFMNRKRSQFRAMRVEIQRLEAQVKYLQAAKELEALAAERRALEVSTEQTEATIHRQVWRQP